MNTAKLKDVTKFEFLDSFRGFLAFTVILGHYWNFAGGMHWAVIDWFHTLIGVVGFFVLSSFLLTYRLLSEFMLILSKTDKTIYHKIKLLINSVIKFAIRRITRIHPLYIIVAAAIKYGPPFTKDAFRGLPDNFWHILFVIDSGTNTTWTIRVEMIYYLFIPFICIFTSLCSKRCCVLPVVWLIGMCIYCDTHWAVQKCGGNVYCTHYGFKAWFSAFLAGSLLAIVYYWMEDYAASVSSKDIYHNDPHQNHSYNIFETILSSRVINLLNFFCYFMSIIFILLLNRHWGLLFLINIDKHKVKLFNYPAYHWCLVLFAALLSRGSFTNLFNNRFWNQAGKISFSIYLTHIVWARYLNQIMNSDLYRGFEGFGIFVFLIMFSSTITYHLIEYPGMWFGTKLCRLVDELLGT